MTPDKRKSPARVDAREIQLNASQTEKNSFVDPILTGTAPEVTKALDVARYLAENGVPIFLAKPSSETSTGYALPKGWQHTEPDPAILDAWRPGLAVCAVMGHTVDAVDLDPRAGGVLPAQLQPRVYGVQSTPSGGTHELVAPLGVRSKDGVLPGVDVKAGHGGQGHGFIFIPPTERVNHDDEIGGYEWIQQPNLDVLDPLIGARDTTGRPLAERITADRTAVTVATGYDGPAYDALEPAQQGMAQQVQNDKLEHWRAALAEAATWPEGKRDAAGRGWEALARDFAWTVATLAANPWAPLTEDSAPEVYAEVMPEVVANDPKCRGKFNAGLIRKAAREPVDAPPWEDFEALEVDTLEASTVTVDPGELDPSILKQFVDGGSFIFDIPDTIPAIWGDGRDVLWADGEALMIVGSPGVGKTTLSGQIVRGLIFGGELLDLPIVPTPGKILYLAMDRPPQVARSLGRHFHPSERAQVSEKLVLWPGPPPEDFAQDTQLLLKMCRAVGASAVVVDSLKDAAVALSEDAVGSGYNRARQAALADGVQVLELHHSVKRGNKGSAPDTLPDVFGSTWLTSGAGSVVLLKGDPGDAIVNFRHLKQPDEVVGPFKVFHDHARGVSKVFEAADPVALAAMAGASGITVGEYATELHDTSKPTPNQIETARRKLDRLVKQGVLTKGQRENPGGGKPISVYFSGREKSTADDDFGGGIEQSRSNHAA